MQYFDNHLLLNIGLKDQNLYKSISLTNKEIYELSNTKYYKDKAIFVDFRIFYKRYKTNNTSQIDTFQIYNYFYYPKQLLVEVTIRDSEIFDIFLDTFLGIKNIDISTNGNRYEYHDLGIYQIYYFLKCASWDVTLLKFSVNYNHKIIDLPKLGNIKELKLLYEAEKEFRRSLWKKKFY